MSISSEDSTGILLYIYKNGPSTKMVRKLMGARNALKRMDLFQGYMKKTLENYESSVNVPKKDDKLSEEFRKQGNVFSIKKDFEKALDCFNKSIRYAKKDSANLGLAYANRSGLYFDKGLQEQSVKDIDLALSHNYPNHMKDKLLKRKEFLLDELSNTEKFVYYEPIPDFSADDRNPFIQSARNNIKFAKVPMGGRRLVASRKIDVGEIIFVEQPYVALLDQEASNMHCSHCMEYNLNLIPCPNCCQEMYCGEDCLQEAANNYHKYECRFIDLMMTMDIDANWRLSLRAMLIGRYEYGDTATDYFRSDKFNELYYMYGHCFEVKVQHRFLKRSMLASLMYNLLKKYTRFFDDFPEEYRMEDNFRLMITTVHRNIWTSKTTINKNLGKERIGLGIYLLRSLFGFSCEPNIFLEHRGCSLVGRAYRTIQTGEECCLVYATKETSSLIYTHVPKYIRTQMLKLFNIHCQCKACTRNWPMIKYMPIIPVEGITYLSLHEIYRDYVIEGNRDEIPKAIAQFESCIRKVEAYQPNLIMVTAQKFLHNCYMLMGNRSLDLSNV